MRTANPPAIDERRSYAFEEKPLGDKLRLCKAPRERVPLTSAALALGSGPRERYVLE